MDWANHRPIRINQSNFYLLTSSLRHWVTVKQIDTASHLVDRFKVVARCFVIMGMPEMFKLIACILEFLNGRKDKGTVILYLISLLTGLYMFVTLICRMSVLRKLKSRFTATSSNPVRPSCLTPQTSLNTSISSSGSRRASLKKLSRHSERSV